ncbi:MAG TPA: hypothetical protein VHA56_10745 [Mucilaginibacter sp.]|nr:hypothetical protein [Mucilaginibacter sp.]
MKILTSIRVYGSLLLAIAVICCCLSVNAQTKGKAKPKPPATAKTTAAPAAKTPAKPPVINRNAVAVIDTFFKKYKDDGTAAAIDYLFATNKYFTNPEGISQLKAKLDSLRQGIGAFLGKELIAQKSASSSLVFYSYLVKHEVQPIRFTFIFYKPDAEWVLYRFKYDDQMDAELEEAGRISNKH